MPRARRAKGSAKGARAGVRGAMISAVAYVLLYFVIAFLLSGAVAVPYFAGLISSNQYAFMTDAVSLLSLSFAAFAYLGLYKRIAAGRAARALGFISDRLPRNLTIGMGLFAIILALELAVTYIGYLTNVQISTNVSTVFAGAPLWFFAFAAVIEPINEEIFFRGFLIARLDAFFGAVAARGGFAAAWFGTIASALIFGMAHYSYYSTYGIEVIAALIFGLLAGYVFKKTKSIYPGVLAHILVNSLGVIAVLMLIR